MKKILAAVLALVMMMGCVSVFAEGDIVVLYQSDINASKRDGWMGNNCEVKAADDGTLTVTGRTQGWQAPQHVFKLQPGIEYTISVEVLQEELDEAVISITANCKIDGNQEYIHLLGGDEEEAVKGLVKKGEWTTVEAVYTFEKEPVDCFLYVETIGDATATMNYKIRNFVIKGPEGAL